MIGTLNPVVSLTNGNLANLSGLKEPPCHFYIPAILVDALADAMAFILVQCMLGLGKLRPSLARAGCQLSKAAVGAISVTAEQSGFIHLAGLRGSRQGEASSGASLAVWHTVRPCLMSRCVSPRPHLLAGAGGGQSESGGSAVVGSLPGRSHLQGLDRH